MSLMPIFSLAIAMDLSIKEDSITLGTGIIPILPSYLSHSVYLFSTWFTRTLSEVSFWSASRCISSITEESSLNVILRVFCVLVEESSFVDDGCVYILLNICLNIGKMRTLLTFPI